MNNPPGPYLSQACIIIIALSRPCRNVTDTLDIYFKRPSERATSFSDRHRDDDEAARPSKGAGRGDMAGVARLKVTQQPLSRLTTQMAREGESLTPPDTEANPCQSGNACLLSLGNPDGQIWRDLRTC